MLQLGDAQDHFNAALKNIKKDKAYASDKNKKQVVDNLDAAVSTMDKLLKEQKRLQDCISELSKIKDDITKYNQQQHQFMDTISSIGKAAAQISPDTKANDFATIAGDAKQLQALNDMNGPVFPKS